MFVNNKYIDCSKEVYKMEIARKRKSIYIILFQLCIICNSILGSDAVYYKYSRIVMFVFFCSMLVCIMCDGFKIRVGRGLIFLLLFTIYSFASLLWSHYQEVAFSQFLTQIQLYILCFFSYLVIRREGNIEDYLNAIYLSGFLMIVWALYRYGGFSGYLSVMESGVRVGGEIANQNTYGMVFSNAACSAFYYAILKNKKIHYLSVVPFAFFGLSSGSKKALLMFILAAIGLFIAKYGIKKIYKSLLKILVILIIAMYVLSFPIFSTINERVTSYLSGDRNVSDITRERMIEFGIDMFKEHPFLGYGLSNYSQYYGGTYSHNNFIEVVVSLGSFGFVLYYSMYIVPMITIVHLWYKKRKIKNENIMLLLLLIVDLVFGYGMVQFYGKSSWILIGTALATNDELKCVQRENRLLEENNAGYYFEKNAN